MISALYASIMALWLCYLALNVVRHRRDNRVKHGDGGVEALQVARSAHSNTVDNIPIVLLLLFFLESAGAAAVFVHAVGILFVVGRLVHSKGILQDKLKLRVLGMQITVTTIISLALANVVYFVLSLV